MRRRPACSERDRLKWEFRLASLTYTRLYGETGSVGKERLSQLQARVEEAKRAYTLAKWVLKNHRTEHGC